jgi:hypothetical protein
MKSAEDIACEIIPEPGHIPVQGAPAWIREDIEDVLRPLIAVVTAHEMHLGTCPEEPGRQMVLCKMCRAWIDIHPHKADCPIPDALEVLKP